MAKEPVMARSFREFLLSDNPEIAFPDGDTDDFLEIARNEQFGEPEYKRLHGFLSEKYFPTQIREIDEAVASGRLTPEQVNRALRARENFERERTYALEGTEQALRHYGVSPAQAPQTQDAVVHAQLQAQNPEAAKALQSNIAKSYQAAQPREQSLRVRALGEDAPDPTMRYSGYDEIGKTKKGHKIIRLK